ncbi:MULTISPECIES: mechanosensitive ion channel family protein [unclassified Polaribacter]|jgi:small conductance mechanosensitive channel|uniref:mechanosensitive ion channel family protein n=1 Tax=unclassified Polaribacter TaxID=196858 RepID=UPI001C4F7399|nr:MULTISPECIES: mechanosensitive ion channel family protein [unclassified Polaribacter]QXP65180.1 mechanosensitive ion channel family protein [Polaribacter sp. HaHaR_3_91]QXP67675.1 mechanosensitive ion channel family protein [Polaribacter sp. AHE13PA]QXP69833.1 mechanosensitive ion channel family protein [Polaribacter sp. R2A056_3_33]
MDKITEKLEIWKDVFIKNIPNIAIAVVVLFVAYFASRGMNSIVNKTIGKKIRQKSVRDLVSRFASALTILVGLYLAMTVLKFDDTLKAIISAAGVSGIVIGLALQGTLSNTISGVVLSFRQNLNIGNWVETNGYSGEVIDINLNYFVIKEADNNMVVIPNKTILESPFKNYSLTTKMRISIECGVEYGADLEKVQALTKEVIGSNFSQNELGKNVEFYFTEFGDSSINFLCRFWIDSTNALEKLKAKSDAIIKIKQAFDKENISIPFPMRTLEILPNQRLDIKNIVDKEQS